jgi:hypothetical protein
MVAMNLSNVERHPIRQIQTWNSKVLPTCYFCEIAWLSRQNGVFVSSFDDTSAHRRLHLISKTCSRRNNLYRLPQRRPTIFGVRCERLPEASQALFLASHYIVALVNQCPSV